MNKQMSVCAQSQVNNQSQHLVVGLTGGIGSGKTAVSDWFAEKGIDIIDADVIAHQIVAKGSTTLQSIADKFGAWVIAETGELDRQQLRDYVFNNPNALVDLESITHPAIRRQAHQQLEQADSAYVIISAPLLLESSEAGLASLCDCILVVDVPEDLQLIRASQRDGQTSKKIQAVMNNQFSRQKRLSMADKVVVNDGTLEELYDKLQVLHKKFLAMATTK